MGDTYVEDSQFPNLERERNNLEIKIGKLTRFLNDRSNLEVVSSEEWRIMGNQLDSMNAYNVSLTRRIAMHKGA